MGLTEWWTISCRPNWGRADKGGRGALREVCSQLGGRRAIRRRGLHQIAGGLVRVDPDPDINSLDPPSRQQVGGPALVRPQPTVPPLSPLFRLPGLGVDSSDRWPFPELLCGSRSSSPPPFPFPCAAHQVSELTTQIDGLFLRCFAGLEVEVESEETMGGRRQQQEQQQEGEGGRAAATAAPPPHVERFDGGLTEAQFGDLGRTRPKVGLGPRFRS